jgi:hypothetical protein
MGKKPGPCRPSPFRVIPFFLNGRWLYLSGSRVSVSGDDDSAERLDPTGSALRNRPRLLPKVQMLLLQQQAQGSFPAQLRLICALKFPRQVVVFASDPGRRAGDQHNLPGHGRSIRPGVRRPDALKRRSAR